MAFFSFQGPRCINCAAVLCLLSLVVCVRIVQIMAGNDFDNGKKIVNGVTNKHESHFFPLFLDKLQLRNKLCSFCSFAMCLPFRLKQIS